MNLLLGKPVADQILARLKGEISLGIHKPGIAVILVGDDKASHIYVDLKEKRANEIEMNFFRFDLPANTPQQQIIHRIQKLNHDEMVHGIIVQLPLPQGFEAEEIIAAIDPKKDADGFHPHNSQLFLQGDGNIWPVFPRAIVRLIESADQSLAGRKAVVIANSAEFGRVMSAALGRQNLSADYILASEVQANLGQIKQADVVVSAVGLPGLLIGEMFKEGAIVIDGGIEKVADKVLGDVNFGSTEGLSGWISPVPGGVGPLTIACLLENTYLAFKAQQK